MNAIKKSLLFFAITIASVQASSASSFPEDLGKLAADKGLLVSPREAWDYGASSWSMDTWEDFIFGGLNKKSSVMHQYTTHAFTSFLSTLPDEKSKRCDYLVQARSVIDEYQLRLPKQKEKQMQDAFRQSCPNDHPQNLASHSEITNAHHNYEHDSEIGRALRCAEAMRPLWNEFLAFKDDALFKRVGFAAAHPYNSWLKRVENLIDDIFDPELSDRDRMRNAVCSRWGATEDPTFPESLTSSPHPYDMIYASRGFYGQNAAVSDQIAKQKYTELLVFFEWAAAKQ